MLFRLDDQPLEQDENTTLYTCHASIDPHETAT
jgi:hypothetical protein